jgi:hypothetical protein
LPPQKESLVPFALDLLHLPFEIVGDSARRLRSSAYRALDELC